MASWGRLENVLILGSNLGVFSALKLEFKIDHKSLLGAILVQDDPKHHFGSILAPIWDRFWSILGSISEHSGTDVEMIFATKLDRNFGVP